MFAATRTLPLALLLSLAACRATAGEAPDAASVRPTLKQIFLIPGIQGHPPRVQSLSADGEWLLLRWNPMTTDEEGERAIESAGALRLLRVGEPERSEYRGQPLIELLPLPEVDEAADEDARSPGTPTTAWSRSGSTLAAEVEGRIWLLRPPVDGDAWEVELLFANPEAEEPPEDEREGTDAVDEEEDEGEPETTEKPRRLKRVRSLSFTEGDRALGVSAGGELVEFPLDAPRPVHLDAAHWLTDVFEHSVTGVQWSEDRTVAFSSDGVGQITSPGLEEGELDSTTAQVRLADGRLVVLDGFEALKDLERESLSPDGRWVIAMTSDDSEQPEATLVPDYLTTRVSTRNARSLWADDTAAPRTYRVWETSTGERSFIYLPDDEGTWVSTLGWAPRSADSEDAPARYAWRRVSADWRTMEIWTWSQGEAEKLYTERDEHWVGGPAAWPQWSPDGRRFLYGSEIAPSSLSPGRSQVFAIDAKSGALRQLTEVEGEVSRLSSTEDGAVVFVASDADPAQSYLGIVAADAVAGRASGARSWARRLPVPPGVNDSPRTSRDGSRIVFSHHELGLPAELWCVDADGRSEAWPLTRTVPPEYTAIDWIRPVKFEARHADGTRVRSHVYLPRGVSLARPRRPRACIVFIHGAGYLQNVTDSMTEYDVNLMFHSRLAELGYVVVDVDYRGSKGYGNDFRTRLQYHLGGLDLDDIHLVLDALADRGVIDGARVGCYGGSYGGFLTMMALFTAPDRWAAGAALRSVTDWRTYHPRYTQPRLGRPSTHAEAFERSSPIDHAAQLEDPLLILHGMLDTNVFAQDSIRLMEKLIDLGLDFDAMLYPSQGHAFNDGAHWLDEYRRIERFLTGHLGPP